MLAAVARCEMTFNLMLKYEDGARVLKENLLYLAQAHDQPQLISHHNSVSKLLHVS